MKGKILITTILLTAMLLTLPAQKAEAYTARSSAVLVDADLSVHHEDRRIVVLQKFLEQYDSPLAPFASTFVEEADKNRIDWKLIVAIAGNESYFGHLIPPSSYNAWGFGVYGVNVRNFSSWDDGIRIVSKAIRADYMDKWGATNTYGIGAIYAQDPGWAYKVSSYIDKIELFNSNYKNNTLSISL